MDETQRMNLFHSLLNSLNTHFISSFLLFWDQKSHRSRKNVPSLQAIAARGWCHFFAVQK